MLGELHLQHGQVSVNGAVGYVPQTSWIPNGSFRDVVLFGNEYDQVRYDSVLQVCCLKQDLAMLESGDLTEIGGGGVNLSGGQKQRASIARAVYENSDIYIFDDPLSALDGDIGTQVFKNCFKGFLKDKTRILVTHQLSVLTEVDRIIVMETGEDGSSRVRDQGTLSALTARGFDFTSLESHEYSGESHASASGEDSNKPSLSSQVTTTTPLEEIPTSTSTEEESMADADVLNLEDVRAPSQRADSPLEVKTGPAKSLFSAQEERGEGAVSLQVYKAYLNSANKPGLILITLLSFFLANFSQIFQQWIVAAWTSDPLYQRRSTYLYPGTVTT